MRDFVVALFVVLVLPDSGQTQSGLPLSIPIASQVCSPPPDIFQWSSMAPNHIQCVIQGDFSQFKDLLDFVAKNPRVFINVIDSRGKVGLLSSVNEREATVHFGVAPTEELFFQVTSYQGMRVGSKIKDYMCDRGTVKAIFSNGMALISYGIIRKQSFILQIRDGMAFNVKHDWVRECQ